MKHYKGYIMTGTSDVETYDFEVPDDATAEDVDCAAIDAFWESGLIDIWWEEQQ